MCFGSGPKAPPPMPPPPQALKTPDPSPLKRRNQASGGFDRPQGSTLLTSPTGIESTLLNTGATTLLGGA